MIEFLVERKIKKMEDEELADFYIKNANNMSLSLKNKIVIESAKRELLALGINDCSIKIENLPDGFEGLFKEVKNKKEIIISKSILENASPVKVFGVIKHECMHALQSKLEKEFPQDSHSIKLDYSRNKYNEDLNFCNFHFKNNKMYISNEYYISYEGNDIAEMFYHLCISEREAFDVEYKRNKELSERNGLLFVENNKVEEQLDFFRKKYNCPNLTSNEIFDLIDSAYANLIEGKYPGTNKDGNLCANIMYDLCVVSASISGNMDKNTVIEYLKKSRKQNELLGYNYTNVNVEFPSNSLSDKLEYYLAHLSKVGEMSDIVQKDNPSLLSTLCIFTNGDALKYVKDKDYLFKKVADMPLTSIRFEDIFGSAFTPYTNTYGTKTP